MTKTAGASPITIADLVPSIVEHINTERWHQRARLLLEVASRMHVRRRCPSCGHELPERSPGPVFMTRADIFEALGVEGRNLQRWLPWLAERRILRRWSAGAGRPAAWAVSPDVGHWREVPWVTPQRRVARDVEGRLRGGAEPRVGARPGRSERGLTPPREGVAEPESVLLPRTDGPANARNGPANARCSFSSAGQDDPTAPQTRGDSAPLTVLPVGTTYLPVPVDGDRDGDGEAAAPRRAPGPLVLAVRQGTGQRVYGAPLRELLDLEEKLGEGPAGEVGRRLLANCPRTFGAAIRACQEIAATVGPAPARWTCPDCGVIGRPRDCPFPACTQEMAP